MSVTPAQHAHLKSIAQQGGYARTAKLGRKASGAALRRGFEAKFERLADEKFGPFPDTAEGRDDRLFRAEMLMRQHMADLARRSRQARAGDGTGRA